MKGRKISFSQALIYYILLMVEYHISYIIRYACDLITRFTAHYSIFHKWKRASTLTASICSPIFDFKKCHPKSVFKWDLPCLGFLATVFLLAPSKERAQQQMWCEFPRKQAGQKCKVKWEFSLPKIMPLQASVSSTSYVALNFHLQETLGEVDLFKNFQRGEKALIGIVEIHSLNKQWDLAREELNRCSCRGGGEGQNVCSESHNGCC